MSSSYNFYNSLNSRGLLRTSCLQGCGWCPNPSPYYQGPCPDVGGAPELRGGGGSYGGGCGSGCGGGGGCGRVQGRFMCPIPLNAVAGASIPLIPCGDPQGIGAVGGAVEIKEAGIYYAALSLTVPAGSTLTTELIPTLNGVPLAAGEVRVEADAPTAAETYSGQVMFQAQSGDRLAVSTSEAMSMAATALPALTLDSFRVSEV